MTFNVALEKAWIETANLCRVAMKSGYLAKVEIPVNSDYKIFWDWNDPQDPKWDEADKVHDWRNHVPDVIRAIWPSFNADQRIALATWANDLALREEWE